MTESGKRSHETRVEIDAPIEEVWKALTEAQEIARWFAPKMTVEPGVGGSITADWGPGLEWKTTIEVWEANRHLRLTETRDRVMGSPPLQMPLEPCRLVQDYYLESEGGKTVLRLVHSGFGSSEAWDQEYEGTRGGWAGCFLRLKHGLERHRNEPVGNRIVTKWCDKVDSAEALRRIESSSPELEIVLRSKFQVAGLLPALNGSILNISVQPAPGGTLAYAEMILYGQPQGTMAAVENEWKAKLAKLFPMGA